MVYVLAWLVIGLPLLLLIWLCRHLWEVWQERNEPAWGVTYDDSGNAIARSYDYRKVRRAMPSRGCREAVSIEVAGAGNIDGETGCVTHIATWGELLTAEGSSPESTSETGETGSVSVRIRYLDSHDIEPAATWVTLRGSTHGVSGVEHEPRRRSTVLHLK